LKESRPGRRYQDHYHRRRRRFSSGRSVLRAIFGLVGGFLIVVVGIVAVPGPGPGWLIILLGLGMIAGESLSFARLIDRGEVRLRQMARWIVGVWVTSPTLVKVSIALTVLACTAALGYGIYYLISR
jgi:uncharacterized protein (TIGR02611 family)